MQTSCPFPLHILGVIQNQTPEDESILHSKFSYLHHRGEWYREDPDLLDYIRTHTSPVICRPRPQKKGVKKIKKVRARALRLQAYILARDPD